MLLISGGDCHGILPDGEVSKVKNKKWEVTGKSYYLHHTIEAGPNVGCAWKGFPMVRWQSGWVRWQTIAKTNRTVEWISNCSFFRGFCCGRRWTWTVAAIHANAFLSSSFLSIDLRLSQLEALRQAFLLFFNYTMCRARAKSGEKDFSRQVSKSIVRSLVLALFFVLAFLICQCFLLSLSLTHSLVRYTQDRKRNFCPTHEYSNKMQNTGVLKNEDKF